MPKEIHNAIIVGLIKLVTLRLRGAPSAESTPIQIPEVHTFTSPFLQYSQVPQNGFGNTTTLSPFLNFPPSGASVITPANSCPIIIGGVLRPVLPI